MPQYATTKPSPSGANNQGVTSYKMDWTSGTTLVVPHNLGSADVIVQITNKNNNQLIMVDTVEFTDSNNATLSASESPSGSGWRVIMLKL